MPQVPTTTNKLAYIVWLDDYISTCLQTLSHVWLPSKYGMKQAHREAIVPRRYGSIKKNRWYQNQYDVNITDY